MLISRAFLLPAEDVRSLAHIRLVASGHEQPSVELLGLLVERLTAVSADGFCGQTHIHKAAFIAQELLDVPFGLSWELYRYGPFSRGVRPGLENCKERGTVALQEHPKGVRIVRPAEAPSSRAAAEFQSKLQLLAERLAPMTRPQLEKIATAAWVTRFPNRQPRSVQSRASEMHKLKPHIDVGTAARAVQYLDDFLDEIAKTANETDWPCPDLMRHLADVTRALHPPKGRLEVYRPRLRARTTIED
jgi:hypothetical protein